MEFEEILALLKKDEPIIAGIYLNKKEYTVGTVQIYPRKIYDALFKLCDEDGVKLFSDDSEKELFLEKLRNTLPDQAEIKAFKDDLIKKDESFAKYTDEQVSEIWLSYYKQAEDEELLERLKIKDVHWTFALMMENFDATFSSCMLRILSTAQIRANKEIRKELGLPLLKKEEMKEYIEAPYRKIENILLDTAPGGGRPRKGFVWKEENLEAFYKQVINLQKIKGKPMWQYALTELMEKDFDFYIEEYLRQKTPFKNVPPKLFSDAIKTWKKYKDDFVNIPPEEKPQAFEFQHALYLLNYPKTTFSTAEKYFSKGKKLSNARK